MISHSIPVQVMSNVQSVAAGAGHSVFLMSNGTLLACEDNSSGQLGNGTTNSTSIPVQMISIANVQSVVSGGNHNLFLKNNSTLSACGDNSLGQLGDGTTINRLTPINISF
jgi:alpha-tubulin suppressor-like RCC1 family protein